MNSAALLSPCVKKAKRVLSQKSKPTLCFWGLMAVCVVLTIFFGLYVFLKYIGKAALIGGAVGEMVGALLVSKLLEMLFLALFFMLVFSSIISALSVFFLNEELPTLFASPLSIGVIFRSRFILMCIESSWMVLVFFLPAFCAFACAMKASIWAYVFLPLFLAVFIMLPNLFGAFAALSLSAFFSVRQMKKMFRLLSVLVLTGLIFFLRSLEAEKLLNPNRFSDISDYLINLKIPLIVYSPSCWLHKATYSLFNNEIWLALKEILPLCAAAAVGFALLNFFASKTYLKSWQKASEALNNRVSSLEWLRKIIIFPFKAAPMPIKVIVSKETAFFFRDPAFFSQIFMICAIVAIYAYNLAILPLKDIPILYNKHYKDMLVFFVSPFIGFILASIGMRFVYPSMSTEGRAFWALKASPLSSKKLLASKLAVYFVPMLMLGLALCAVTNHIFQVSNSVLLALSFINTILITAAVTCLGVSVGAVYADFKTDSPLKIAASYGGLIYMLLSGLYIIHLVILEFYPIYNYVFKRFYSPNGSLVPLAVVIALVLVISNALWLIIPFKKGIKTIDNYEP